MSLYPWLLIEIPTGGSATTVGTATATTAAPTAAGTATNTAQTVGTVTTIRPVAVGNATNPTTVVVGNAVTQRPQASGSGGAFHLSALPQNTAVLSTSIRTATLSNSYREGIV